MWISARVGRLRAVQRPFFGEMPHETNQHSRHAHLARRPVCDTTAVPGDTHDDDANGLRADSQHADQARHRRLRMDARGRVSGIKATLAGSSHRAARDVHDSRRTLRARNRGVVPAPDAIARGGAGETERLGVPASVHAGRHMVADYDGRLAVHASAGHRKATPVG